MHYKYILLNILMIYLNYNTSYLITRAKMCKICYSKLTKFNITKNKLFNVYDDYKYINSKKTKSVCYIFYNNSNIDICFKGTSTLTDVYYNLDIYPRKYLNNKIRIHNGYLKKYLSLKDEIITNINSLIKEKDIKEITFNGYSAGGAIANIASLDLSYIYNNDNIKISCITFGAPRVGNEYFMKEYNLRINESIRIVNRNDIIPLVPPPIIYRHNHEAVVMENKKTNYSIFNIYRYIKHTHSIITYIKNLY